ncbi:MAG: hypothetical protein SFT92_06810 [Rickettsiales bacterium]|nr:hypothetical protein [Rickettsiales bacterium]
MVQFHSQTIAPIQSHTDPDKEYTALTRKIVKLTGHEYIGTKDTLISRPEREARYRKALELVNNQLQLGMDDKDLRIMTLAYVALSEVSRFGGEPLMDSERYGENTATHSIHTPLRMHKILRKALQRMNAKESEESQHLRQMTGLCLLMHDLGEAIGEPGSLAQESTQKGFKKDKPAIEAVVMDFILRLATHAVEADDPQAFYSRLDQIKMKDMHQRASVSSNEELLATVRDKLGEAPSISADGEARVELFSDLWNVVEHPNKTPERFAAEPTAFISLLASMNEHAQGTGHFVKFNHKDREYDPNSQVRPTWLAQSVRVMKNASYTEGELGHLYAQAKTPLEKAVAIEAKKEAYTKMIDVLRWGPGAVDRALQSAEENTELPVTHPGRQEEMSQLLLRSMDQEAEPYAIRTIEDRDNLLALYDWALHKDDFVPTPGKTLIAAPPAEFSQDMARTIAKAAGRG